jgi:glycosyltransferase involved in cell wall biosynthesis
MEFKPPLISILLSTYNRARYLPKAIQSVLAQTHTHWQLIISDDGSSDDTWNVLQPYLEDPRIFYLRHTNVKLSRSRNLAAQQALGEYYAILDSDDWYEPQHLQENLEFLMLEDLALCFSKVILHGPAELAWVPDKRDRSKKIHLHDCPVAGTLFFKAEMFHALNGFAVVDYSEDSDFVERAQAAGFKCAAAPFQTYHYACATPNSLIQQQRQKVMA